jgi:hypothetical protein
MNQTSCFANSTHALHCALELSKKSWLLAIQFPDREQPSVYSRRGHRKADGEAHGGPGLLGQGERFVASDHPLL